MGAAFFGNQTAHKERNRQAGNIRFGLEEFRVDAGVVDHRFGVGKSLDQGVVPDEVGNAKETRGLLLKPLAASQVKLGVVRVVARDVISMQRYDHGYIQCLRQLQCIASIGAEVSVDQLRPQISEMAQQGTIWPEEFEARTLKPS